MNRTTLTSTAVATVLVATLTACSSDQPKSASDQTSNGKADASAASQPLDAGTAFAQISGKVSSAKLSGTVTAENDPNHLLGRPNQYTSKITFEDSRVSPTDVSGSEKGDVDRGGAIEVFGSPSDAKARADYIQTATKSMPALAEYDYVHGKVLVRVSHYLTPKQAAAYKTAADGLS
ncbi:hypothetical protein [Streptomyces sp. NRRL S-813]|uniref:hypothetical protein n=1 Tax=Streptomyces sp. NRRL S-813 TaxID=1463919 RepID=UPI0004C25056|nr:hypothetical protein [Streptomyces sp. NRRL S-813]